ncbi:hypothetical protein EDD73_1154 [Heliophilum fasciatum]|uniref:Uncharacterized protein n=1 Tax=Heliophilum fasciatum TaxID=35700 RepID=A0A4R2RLJ3_9FIRM|nr:hypothetical protein EDD73_1154 [Heliophilum fasciatum]
MYINLFYFPAVIRELFRPWHKICKQRGISIKINTWQLAQKMYQVHKYIQVVGLCRFHNAVHHGARGGPFRRVGEEPAFTANDKGADRIFSTIIRQFNAPIFQKCAQW